jgi:alpha-beta hydrolase superfamily lysophospholipase
VYHYPTRVRNYLQYTAAAAAALAAAGAVRLPLLVYHGEQDQTADVQGSQQLVAAAKVRAAFFSKDSC